MNPWYLYDQLLAQVHSKDRIAAVVFGSSWTMVRTEEGLTGIAAAQWSPRKTRDANAFLNMPLTEATRLVTSWNFVEATIGQASLNACCNRLALFPHSSTLNPDAFLRYKDLAKGRNVAVIGRFAYLESRLEPLCNLHVLERQPGAEDYPDPACEYLLPEMELVFITGSALANKTLPRLLELSRNAYTVISGPSTPMHSVLFDLGADSLCGFCVTDPSLCQDAVMANSSIFRCGTMVCLEKDTANQSQHIPILQKDTSIYP